MDFSLKELTSLSGITRDQANQWMKLGVFAPSRKKGTGRGSSQNLFTLVDCYQAIVFKKLTDGGNGWKRDVAVEMMRSMDKEEFSMFVAACLWSGESLIKFSLVDKMASDGFYKRATNAVDVDPSTAFLFENMFAKGIAGVKPVSAFLAFIKFEFQEIGDRFICLPVVNDCDPIGSFSSWDNVSDHLSRADGSYIMNFGKLVAEVDVKLMSDHKEKLRGVSEKTKGLLSEIRKWRDSDGSITKGDLLSKFLSMFG